MNAEIKPETVKKQGNFFNYLIGIFTGIMFGLTLAFLNPWDLTQFVPGSQMRSAIAFCDPHDGLIGINAVHFAHTRDDDRIVCSDESAVLYKHIKNK